MPTPFRFLIVVGVLVIAVVLVLPSFTARAIVAAVLILAAVVWLLRAFSKNTSTQQLPTAGEERSDDDSPADTFALGKLFEATMHGMREGLIVVDKDMRVVASNAVAHRLFNLSRGKLDSQRLTELTRNPAIYSAFLDALKGTERSGVKVETHGPERLVFDLRVVPLTNSNGKPEGSAAGLQAQGALGVFIDVTRLERLEQVRQEF